MLLLLPECENNCIFASIINKYAFLSEKIADKMYKNCIMAVSYLSDLVPINQTVNIKNR